MALASVTYPCNGTSGPFNLTYPYIAEEHVHAFIDNVEVSFTFLTTSTVNVPAAAAFDNTHSLRLARTTPTDEPIVDWANGANINEETLDLQSLQLLYATQETQDGSGAVIATGEAALAAAAALVESSAEDREATEEALADAVLARDASAGHAEDSEEAADASEASAIAAAASLAAASLPADLTGDALKFLRVKADETGYEHQIISLLGDDVQPYLGQVANAGRMPTSFDSVNKQIMSSVPLQARDHIQSLRFRFGNYYVNSGSETGSGATAGITCGIEYPTGVFTQVKFSGSASGSIPNNNELISDETIIQIPDGAEFIVHTRFTSTGGVLYNEKSNGISAMTVSGGTDKTMTGGVVDDGNGYSYSPIAVLGMTRRRTVVLVGDSHVVGRDDTPDATRDLGSLQRSIGPYFGTIVLAKSGDSANGYVGSHTRRQAVIDAYATDLVVQLAHNDLYNSGRTPAQVKASVETILGYAPDHVRKFVTTLQPKTTSTDDWATLGNMTVDPATSNAQTYNGLVRAGSIVGADGFFDICRAIESSVDSGKQKVTGAAFGYTVDGSHLNREGQILIRDSGVVDVGLIRGVTNPRFASPRDVERGKAADLMVSPQSLYQGGLIDQGQVNLTVGFRTPGDQDVVYTRRTCNWYRVGDLVWCNTRITCTITHTTVPVTARLEIKGWPFEHADNNISGSLSFHNATLNYDASRTAVVPRFSTITTEKSTLVIGMSGDSTDTENVDAACLTSPAAIDIMMTIVYKRGTPDVL